MVLLKTEKQKRIASWIHWVLTIIVTVLILSVGQFKEHIVLLTFVAGCVNLVLQGLGRLLPNSEQTDGKS